MISKNKDRVILSLDKDQIKSLEQTAQNTGLSKSQIVAYALTALVAWDTGKAIGQALIDRIDAQFPNNDSRKKRAKDDGSR